MQLATTTAQQHRPAEPLALHQLPADEEDMLLSRIRTQVDFYFSPQNLAKDDFLRSMLQSYDEHHGAVPVQAICNFPKIRELSASAWAGYHVPAAMAPPADPELLCRAAQYSRTVRVVGDPHQQQTGYWFIPVAQEPTAVAAANGYNSQDMHPAMPRVVPPTPPDHHRRPSDSSSPSDLSSPLSSSVGSSQGVPVYPLGGMTMERTVVLLHELPDPAAESLIWQFFLHKARPKSVVQDAGRTWHVTFGTELEAVAALDFLKDKSVNGKPVHAGLKNANGVQPPQLQPHQPHQPYWQQQYWQQQQQQHAPGQHHYVMNQYMPPLYGNVMVSPPPFQYSYGYAAVPSIVQQGVAQGIPVAPPYVPPPPQIGYAVPLADYGRHQLPPPPPPPPPQQVFVRSQQHDDRTLESHDAPAIPETPSQDTTPKKSHKSKKGHNNNKKDGKQLQRSGSNQSSGTDARGEINKNGKNKSNNGNNSQQGGKNGNRNNAYKNKKKGGQQGSNTKETGKVVLAEEQFPALGGSRRKAQKDAKKDAPKKAAYAEALLKPPTRASVPTGTSGGQAKDAV